MITSQLRIGEQKGRATQVPQPSPALWWGRRPSGPRGSALTCGGLTPPGSLGPALTSGGCRRRERDWQMAVSSSQWPSAHYLDLLTSEKLINKLEGGAEGIDKVIQNRTK